MKILCLWKGANFDFEATVFKLLQNRFIMISRRIFMSVKFLFQTPPTDTQLTPHPWPFPNALGFPSAVFTWYFSLWQFIYFCTDFLFFKKKNKENVPLKLWRDKPFKTWSSLVVFFFFFGPALISILGTIKKNNFPAFRCLKIGNDDQRSWN